MVQLLDHSRGTHDHVHRISLFYHYPFRALPISDHNSSRSRLPQIVDSLWRKLRSGNSEHTRNKVSYPDARATRCRRQIMGDAGYGSLGRHQIRVRICFQDEGVALSVARDFLLRTHVDDASSAGWGCDHCAYSGAGKIIFLRCYVIGREVWHTVSPAGRSRDGELFIYQHHVFCKEACLCTVGPLDALTANMPRWNCYASGTRVLPTCESGVLQGFHVLKNWLVFASLLSVNLCEKQGSERGGTADDILEEG